MTALLRYDLPLDTQCDFTASFTWGTAENDLTSFVGATAALQIRALPSDAVALVSISTTPGASGAVYLGIAPPGALGGNVANVAALATFDATGLTAGTLVAVTTPVSYYAWSPGGVLVGDGITIVSGVGGQWLLSATIRFTISKAAMAALVGTDQASYDLLVTWADGTTTKFLEGYALVDQTVTR